MCERYTLDCGDYTKEEKQFFTENRKNYKKKIGIKLHGACNDCGSAPCECGNENY